MGCLLFRRSCKGKRKSEQRVQTSFLRNLISRPFLLFFFFSPAFLYYYLYFYRHKLV